MISLESLTIKRGDTGLGIKANLSNEIGNLDLKDANITLLFGGHEIEAKVSSVHDNELMVFLNEEHTSKVGSYDAEFKVEFKDGRIETFPSDGYLKVNIIRDLKE